MPPRPVLIVMSGEFNLPAAFRGMQLAFDCFDIFDRGEVEIFAPYEGTQGRQKPFAETNVAGVRPAP